MIVVDSSAIMAVAMGEPEADACVRALERGGELLMSAATLAETLIVASRRGVGRQTAELIADLSFMIEPILAADAYRAAAAHDKWGKGVHPAGLNFGDCFAYALAKQRGCPLLYIGNDFAQTDVQGVDFAEGPA